MHNFLRGQNLKVLTVSNHFLILQKRLLLIIHVDEWCLIDEFSIEESLELFPMLLEGHGVEITIELLVVGGSGDACWGVGAAVVVADLVLLD